MSKIPDRTPKITHRGVEQLGDFTTVDRRLVFISLAAIVIGTIAAFIAVALLALIGFFTNLFYYGRISFQLVSPAGNELGLLAIAVPAIGGLVVGFMARYGSERIRGHGIPEALEAILINKSKIEPKVTILKPVSTAISIGSGGPFGAEGPIIMTGGAFGSVFSQFLKLSSMERKTLLVAGAAAGMAATFNSPVSAVLLAVELLLFEWKPRSLIPVAAASATACLARGILINTSPLFPISSTPIPTLGIVTCAIFVGVIAGGASTALTYAVYAAEDAFRKLPIHWMWWPMIGGLVIGIGGFFSPRALGVGYDTIDALLLGNLAIDIILVLVIVKAVIWSISLGSGTSGGVLAPLLIMGGSVGALEGHLLPFGTIPLWVLVSMGAMIGGTMRSPFTGVVFSLELTHDVNALLPLLVGAVCAETVTVFSMKRSILTEKVARRGVHVAREYSVDVLELTPVSSVFHRNFREFTADSRLEQIMQFDSNKENPSGYPIVDGIGAIQGYMTRKQVASLLQSGVDQKRLIRDFLPSSYSIVFSDEPLRVAADRMAQNNSESLPVVDQSDPQKVVGIVSQEDLFAARVLWFADEKNREKVLSVPSYLTTREMIQKRFSKIRRRRKASDKADVQDAKVSNKTEDSF
jgi:chloride channel protein, CIC family